MPPRVGLFIPCYIDQCFPHIGRATVGLLERLGVACDYDPQQTCCGQPAYNSGYHPHAACLAEQFVRVFNKYEQIVSPGGSCVGMVRNQFQHLLGRDEPVTHRVHELCEFLVNHLNVDDLDASLYGRAALHVPCHMLRELDGDGPVRGVLSRVRGLEIVALPSDAWCCGFGGTFSVKYPELSAAMGERKLRDAVAAGVDYVLSPEASCLMQLDGLIRRLRLPLHAMHVVELFAGGNVA